jgi:hypothetical protein
VLRSPALEDGFVCSARLLGVGPDEVEPLIHVERLELALALPRLHVSGAPFYKTAGQVAACIWRNCALTKILPRENVRFGFAMSMIAVDAAGYEWKWKQGDEGPFVALGRKLAAGQDPGSALVSFMSERIVIPKRPKPKRIVAALRHALHLTGPASSLEDHEWPIIQDWAWSVDDAVVKFVEEQEEPLDIYTQRPRSSVQLNYDDELSCDLDERFREAHAVIVLGYKPSEGVGIKVEKAARRLLPILYLHPNRSRPGRRMRRQLAEVGANVKSFEYDETDTEANKERIQAITLEWLRKNAAAIVGAARLRQDHEGRVARMLSVLRTAATQMEPHQLRMALGAVRLTEKRAWAMLESEWDYLAASVHEQLSLSAALGVSANIDGVVPQPVSERPPYLTEEEITELRRVARVDRIPPIEELQMVALAQEELARLGRKRCGFFNDIAWRDLRRRLKK